MNYVMKKLLLLFALVVAVALNVNAQDDDDWDNEISLSYGIGAFTDVSSSYLSGVNFGKQTHYIGPFGLEYIRRPSERFGVGLLTTVGTCKWSESESSRATYIGIMPAVKYNWYNRERFSMYSKAAIGVIIGVSSGNEKNSTQAAFGWQATPIGAEYGTMVRGFVELGFGEQGFLAAGLRVKF